MRNRLQRIQKYNKNHSPKDGKFTSGGSGAGGEDDSPAKRLRQKSRQMYEDIASGKVKNAGISPEYAKHALSQLDEEDKHPPKDLLGGVKPPKKLNAADAPLDDFDRKLVEHDADTMERNHRAGGPLHNPKHSHHFTDAAKKIRDKLANDPKFSLKAARRIINEAGRKSVKSDRE